MTDKTEYGPVRPFGIDHGQLDGFRPNEIFVLGYELAQVDHLLSLSVGFGRPVHAANSDRIEAQCKRLGRSYSLTWMEHDLSESWKWLNVNPAP